MNLSVWNLILVNTDVEELTCIEVTGYRGNRNNVHGTAHVRNENPWLVSQISNRAIIKICFHNCSSKSVGAMSAFLS